MNLARSLINTHQPGFIGHLLQRHFLGHSHGAESLHGMVDHVPGHFRCEHLDHGHLGARLLTAINPCGRFVGHQAAGMNAGCSIGNPPLDGLALGQRRTESCALWRVLAHHVKRPLRAPDAPRSDLHATAGKTRLHRRKPRTLLAKKLPVRHTTVFQQHLISRYAADHGDATLHREACRCLVNDKSGDAATGPFDLVRHRHDDGPIRLGGSADPYLAAVQDPIIAVTHRARCHGRRIGPSTGF